MKTADITTELQARTPISFSIDDNVSDGDGDNNPIHFIRVCSDLHLEHRDRHGKLEDEFLKAIPPDGADASSLLILAGDIDTFRYELSLMYSNLCRRFKEVLHIPGNHEFWGADDITEWTAFIEKEMDDLENLHICGVPSNSTLSYRTSAGKLLVVAATLWTDQNKLKPTSVLRTSGWPDFRHIKLGGKPFTPQAMVELHACDRRVIEASLKLEDSLHSHPAGVVVATHYLPSFKLCVQGERAFDHMFASDLDHMFVDSWAPDLWIHAHSHAPSDTYLGRTHVVANPRGYPGERPGPVQKLIIPVKDIARKPPQ